MPQVAPLASRRSQARRALPADRAHHRDTGQPAPRTSAGLRPATGSRVTLFAADRTPDGAARDRFTAEARAARRVSPFCAARILDTGIEAGQAYLVSEYVPGPLLSEVVAADGPRTGAELEALAIGMATGLAAVHQAGLVHGEFGPEHVVLGVDGPRVIGFDITPPYGNATPAADMLAWAQTVLFAASGTSPSAAALVTCPSRCAAWWRAAARAEPAARPAARQVVVRLIGHDSPQAGVLAEGSRRAAKAAMRAPAEPAAGAARPPCCPAAAAVQGVGWPWPPRSACWLSRWPCMSCRTPARCGHAASRTRLTGPPHRTPARRRPGRPRRVTIAAGHDPGRGIRHLVGVGPAGQRQHRHGVRLDGNSPAGTITYSGTSFTCSGNLTLQSSAGHVLVMNQQIVAGVCLDGWSR